MADRKLILNGKVAMMNANATVLNDGYIFIQGNRIVAVAPRLMPRPAGFDTIPVTRTGGTIFPGLMEMHNHLPYNILPMWEVSKKYDHRGQWRSARGKRQNISTPMSVLGAKKGLGPAIARYAEAKCLMGGVTTTQGITLFSAPGIKKHFRGVTRNVEAPLEAVLPKASTKVPDVAANKLDSFHDALKRNSCFFLHLSEGIGPFARRHFLVLEKPDGTWALENSLTGIHATGLTPPDFAELATAGASIAWSPLSNLLLYGGTTNVTAAKAAGVNIALGSDWSPSGSKNLLAELKIAKSVSADAGNLFTDHELVEMATINAAKALKWDAHIGSLEGGKLADLFVVSGRRGDPYQRLLAAKETQISLVMVDGVARIGRPALFAKLETPTEEVRIGRARRLLKLFDATDDVTFKETTLAVATQTLSDAMQDLPALQIEHEAEKERKRLEREAGPLIGGSVPSSTQTEAETGWFLFDDDEEHDDALSELGLFDYTEATGPIMIGASVPIVLIPMTLDPVTTVDDRHYYKRIKRAHNVPQHIKNDPNLG
ncbi:MAG: amidohydrolase family protein [Nereida ignava]